MSRGERRTISINLDQVKDVLIAHLYAVGILNDNENVDDMSIEINDDEAELELEISLNMRRSRYDAE